VFHINSFYVVISYLFELEYSPSDSDEAPRPRDRWMVRKCASAQISVRWRQRRTRRARCTAC